MESHRSVRGTWHDSIFFFFLITWAAGWENHCKGIKEIRESSKEASVIVQLKSNGGFRQGL